MPTVQDIAARVGGRITGPADMVLTGVEQLHQACAGQITFIGNDKYARDWPSSQASAALIDHKITLDPGPGRALISVPNTDLALAAVLEMFAPPVPRPAPGVHPSAQIDPTAHLAADIAIGPLCIIGARASIGPAAVLHSGVTVMEDSVIGPGCVIWPGVVIRERCRIGARCILHPNAVIGADGFGYRPSADKKSLVKIPQIGSVLIGNDVEIGACTCIDRGKFSDTVIGDECKLDNQVHIAHNVRMGKRCTITAQIAIAGSATIGDDVSMGGKVGIRDHITVGSGATIFAYSAVMGDVPAGATWLGIPAEDASRQLRQMAAIRKLPELLTEVRSIKKSLESPGRPDA